VQAVKAGQSDAFEEIVFTYRDQVFSAAWHLTRNHEDAMDVTQEAFLRAYNALSGYKGKSRFSTWLHRIVLNTGIDFIRREKRHKHLSLDATSGSLEDAPLLANLADNSVPGQQRDKVYESQLQKKVLEAL